MLHSGSFTLILAFLCLFSCSDNSQKITDTQVNLFDGETFTNWKMYGSDTDSISSKWIIQDGMIIASPNGDGVGFNTGFDKSLMTIKQYQNFDLELEFMISQGGNSGIMYHVIQDTAIPMDYFTGLEYQILDDEQFNNKVKDFHLTGSVYGLLPSGAKKLLPAGEWNKARIVVNQAKVEHWLNGALILEFDRNSESFKTTYQNSQWTQFPHWGKSQKGHISLQDHGDKVAFRNIKIREL